MRDLTGSVVVHCSNAELGGAEKSLLAEVRAMENPGRCRFILPGQGSLSCALDNMNIHYSVNAWPPWINWFTQHQLWWQWPLFLLWPVGLVSLWNYVGRLKGILIQYETLVSSGIKSHCLLLPIAPFFKGTLVFNIRDFIEPILFRRFIALTARMSGIRIEVNSQAVGRAYYKPRVIYPSVSLPREMVERRRMDGTLVITHAAYFAPYKGQDIFLTYARKILDAGVRAEFWLVGDVIYPGARYRRFKKKLKELSRQLGLERHLKMWGKVSDVQTLLEQTHVLMHCTRDPEPFGRVVVEALLCGCDVLCHRGSGVCEVAGEKKQGIIDLGIAFEKQFVFLQPGSGLMKVVP